MSENTQGITSIHGHVDQSLIAGKTTQRKKNDQLASQIQIMKILC